MLFNDNPHPGTSFRSALLYTHLLHLFCNNCLVLLFSYLFTVLWLLEPDLTPVNSHY